MKETVPVVRDRATIHFRFTFYWGRFPRPWFGLYVRLVRAMGSEAFKASDCLKITVILSIAKFMSFVRKTRARK